MVDGNDLSPLELILMGKEAPAAPEPPAPEPKEQKPKRQRSSTKIKALHEMVLNLDRRLVGRTTRQFTIQLQLDEDDIREVFGQYPDIMRLNPHTNLWSINPDAEV